MDPSRIVVLLVLIAAVYVGWGMMSGRRGRVPAYVISAVVALSLLGAALTQLAGQRAASEALDVAWLAFSLAGLASPRRPSMWELQIRDDWERVRVYQPFRAADLLSWRGWLKLADRVGTRQAAFGYLGLFGAGIVLRSLVWGLVRGAVDPFLLLALLAPLLFASFSAFWVYRGVRAAMPGA